MTLAAVLFLGAVLIGAFMPKVLRRFESTSLAPAAILTAWIGSIASLGFLAVSAVAILLWPSHAPAEGLSEALVRCFTAFQHAMAPWIGETLAIGGVVVTALIAARSLFLAHRQHKGSARVRDYHRDVVSIIARADPVSDDVLWLDHPMPMAYSVAGRPGFVVATKGLSECLTAPEREAVIAHERAHLRGQHHRIINVCEVFAKALPVIPLFKAAPVAVRRLVELAADDRAAQDTSPDAVRSALSVVATSPLPQPVWTLGLGDDEISVRLVRLQADSRLHGTKLVCISAAVLPMVVPLIAALATLIIFSASAHALVT
ncbi:M56 family metallopeptidase [Rhodococcus globerulus]|uniref:M56 family metallopeptidase n=1 Tax=Rhodococcus globerulus TaxID=33008 RepID=UPI003019A4FC